MQVPSGPPILGGGQRTRWLNPALPQNKSPVPSWIHRGISARSVGANALGLGPRERRCNSCRADQFRKLPWPSESRHPSSKRTEAGATPAGSAIAQWDNSSPPGCYPGRCWCDSSLSSQFTEGRQIQAGCTCPENRIGASRGGSITRAFRQPSPVAGQRAGDAVASGAAATRSSLAQSSARQANQ